MITAVDVWKDEETGSSVQAKSCGRGRCALEFHLTDVLVSIQSSKNAFISASVGPRTHFASPDGACEFARQGNKLKVTVQQWRGGKEQIEIDRTSFEHALRSLTDVDGPTITML